MGYGSSAGGRAVITPAAEGTGRALSNLEAAAEVGKVVGGAALAAGAAAAPVVAGGLVANQLYERFGEEPPSGGVVGHGAPSKAEEQTQVRLDQERAARAEQEQGQP